MKGHEVRIVKIMRATFLIVECRAHHRNDVSAIKLPVGVLEAMPFRIGMTEESLANFPVPQVCRLHQHKRIANLIGLS